MREVRDDTVIGRWAFLAFRLVLGCGFRVHGWAKLSRGPAGFAKLLEWVGTPLPGVTAWVTILKENRIVNRFGMRHVVSAAAACLVGAAPVWAATLNCPPDSAKVGNACIDLYEESVWQIAPSNTSLVRKVQAGKATLADLTRGGATQLGCTFVPFSEGAYPTNFPNDGNWSPVPGSNPPSPGVYAVSIPGVLPTACTTWFQAVQECAVSGKRLARNEEWQRAAAGTPDPGTDDGATDCNTSAANTPVNSGSRSKCKSSWGVFDMVGNVDEWVADWADRANIGCTDWTTLTGIAGGDSSCSGGDGTGAFNQVPGALVRGGFWTEGTAAGVFAVSSSNAPSNSSSTVGFRCAR